MCPRVVRECRPICGQTLRVASAKSWQDRGYCYCSTAPGSFPTTWSTFWNKFEEEAFPQERSMTSLSSSLLVQFPLRQGGWDDPYQRLRWRLTGRNPFASPPKVLSLWWFVSNKINKKKKKKLISWNAACKMKAFKYFQLRREAQRPFDTTQRTEKKREREKESPNADTYNNLSGDAAK